MSGPVDLAVASVPILAAVATVAYRRRSRSLVRSAGSVGSDSRPPRPDPSKRTVASFVFVLTTALTAASWWALVSLADGFGFQDDGDRLTLRPSRFVWLGPAYFFALASANVLVEASFRHRDPRSFPLPGEPRHRERGLAEPDANLLGAFAFSALMIVCLQSWFVRFDANEIRIGLWPGRPDRVHAYSDVDFVRTSERRQGFVGSKTHDKPALAFGFSDGSRWSTLWEPCAMTRLQMDLVAKTVASRAGIEVEEVDALKRSEM